MYGGDDWLGHIIHYKLNKILLIAKHGLRKSNIFIVIYIMLLFGGCTLSVMWVKK